MLAPGLAEAGHEPVLMDFREIETPYEAVRADVRDRAEVLGAVRGADAVVHAAALHGVHLAEYSRDDFWDLNVAGTHNVYSVALECGVGKVLLCSTRGIYGGDLRGAGEPPVITEDLPLQPSDVYGFSKKICEEIATFHARRHGVRTIAYRLGM